MAFAWALNVLFHTVLWTGGGGGHGYCNLSACVPPFW